MSRKKVLKLKNGTLLRTWFMQTVKKRINALLSIFRNLEHLDPNFQCIKNEEKNCEIVKFMETKCWVLVMNRLFVIKWFRRCIHGNYPLRE